MKRKRGKSLPPPVLLSDAPSLLRRPRTWIIFTLVVLAAMALWAMDVDSYVIAAVVLLLGIFTQLFTIILGLIALIPVVGPLVVSLLSLPLFWFIKGTSHMITALAVKQGYGKDIARSKILIMMLTLGMVLGFLIGYYLRLLTN